MKKKILFAIIIATIGLTGCGKAIEITDDQSNMVTEYMANLLLKYDRDYENREVYDEFDAQKKSTNEANLNTTTDQSSIEQVKVDETKVDSNVKVTTVPSTDSSKVDSSKQSNSKDHSSGTNKVNYVDLSAVYNKAGFKFNYSEYSLQDSYPKKSSDIAVKIEASEGYKLLVVKFKVKNTQKKKDTISLMNSGIVYKVKFNEKEYLSVLTLLPNDIQFLKKSIGQGKSTDALLVFEVPDNFSIQNTSVYVTNKDKTAEIQLK